MATGLTPREASVRLSIFQTQFQDLWSKYQTYSGGEQLFGMTVTEYPVVKAVRKELTLLQKLYDLYTTVIDTVTGYNDVIWAEVNIDKINNELLDLQHRSEVVSVP